MILVKLGERTYEMGSTDVEKAREIYVTCVGDQNTFELQMEEAGIDFYIDTSF